MLVIPTTLSAAPSVEAGIEQSRRMTAAVQSGTSGANPNAGAAAVAVESVMARSGIGCGFNGAA